MTAPQDAGGGAASTYCSSHREPDIRFTCRAQATIVPKGRANFALRSKSRGRCDDTHTTKRLLVQFSNYRSPPRPCEKAMFESLCHVRPRTARPETHCIALSGTRVPRPPHAARRRMLRTVVASHFPPRAIAMPRPFRAVGIWRRDPAPAV
jgi:hypothetical protein